MTYNYKSKKIVAVISDKLESWRSMNVLGHMSIALGANKDEDLMGQEVLVDQKNNTHVGIARFGLIVKRGSSGDISELARESKKINDIKVVDFPREMLDTKHDDELVESIKNKSDFEYLGVLIYGDVKQVDLLTKSFKLW